MIREVRKEDAKGIYDLYREVMGYDYPVSKIETRIDDILNDNNNYVFIYELNNKVVGIIETVIKYSTHEDPFLTINTLAIDSEYQGQGIGSKLLDYIEEFASSKNLASIWLGSQIKRNRAHDFYLNHGYTIIKQHKIFNKKLK